MITIDIGRLIIGILIFGFAFGMVGYVIGCIETAEKYEKELNHE